MTLRTKLVLLTCLPLASLVAQTPPSAAATAEESTLTQPALPPVIEMNMPDSADVSVEFPGQTTEDTLVRRDAETISIDFRDAEIRNIIRDVADLYELNVIIPDTLVGSTTVKLRNVSWRQVFDVILEDVGFTYVEERNIVKIKSREDLLQEPMVTRVFVVDYSNANEIQAAVSALIDTAAGGRIQVDTRSNSLVIRERPSRFGNIQEIIQRLDRPTAQVMIESKFIEVTNRDNENLGIQWNGLNEYNVTAGPIERLYERTNETITTAGTAVTTDTVTRSDTALFSASQFEVLLSALENLGESKLISNPTVVTLNNTPAQISIGEEYPVPSYTFNSETGAYEVSDFEFKPIGIQLNVTPQVNSAGFINLNIQPEVSSRNGEVNFGGAGSASIPIISTRKTQNTVAIKDGYTLAIGGLQERNLQDDRTKVPLLGDLPGIGKLFQSKSKEDTKRSLIIFITARVLNPDGSTYEDVFSPRTLSDMGISKTDIPGYKYSEEELDLYNRLSDARTDAERKLEIERLRKQIETLESTASEGTTQESVESAPVNESGPRSQGRFATPARR